MSKIVWTVIVGSNKRFVVSFFVNETIEMGKIYKWNKNIYFIDTSECELIYLFTNDRKFKHVPNKKISILPSNCIDFTVFT